MSSLSGRRRRGGPDVISEITRTCMVVSVVSRSGGAPRAVLKRDCLHIAATNPWWTPWPKCQSISADARLKQKRMDSYAAPCLATSMHTVCIIDHVCRRIEAPPWPRLRVKRACKALLVIERGGLSSKLAPSGTASEELERVRGPVAVAPSTVPRAKGSSCC